MKTKSLFILILLALLIAALAYFTARKSDTGISPRIGQKPFAGRDFNAVTRITLSAPDGTTTVSRAESGWIVPGLHGYWADFEKIRTLIRTLADLKIGDVLRLNDAQKAELQLNAPGAAAGAGTQILLTGPGDTVIARLIVGKRPRRPNASDEMSPMAESMGTRYLALDDGELVQVDNPLVDLPLTDKEWMDPQFLAPSAPNLVRLAVSGPNRPALVLSRAEPGAAWTLEGLSPTQTVDVEKIERVANAIGYLRFNTVADPALSPAKTGLDQPTRLDADTADGRRYSVLLGASDAGTATRYIRVEMAYHPPAEKTPAAVTNAVAQPADTQAERLQHQQEATNFNARFGRWVYTLDDFAAGVLLPTSDDVIKKPEPPPASEPAPAPAQPQGETR